MILLWLLSCTPEPTPEAVAVEHLLAGHQTEALSALERIPPDSAMADWTGVGLRIVALEDERSAIHLAEQDMLLSSAEAAIVRGDLESAIPALRAALELDSPQAHDLLQQLTLAAEQAPPPVAATVYAALSEVWEHNPERYAEYASRTAHALLTTRYTADSLPQTLSARQGVSQPAAAHLLSRLDAEYHTEPDWAVLTRAALSQLSWLSADPGAKAAWPAMTEETWGSSVVAASLETHLQQLSEAIAAGAQVGVPEEVVIAEWVDAICHRLDPWTRAVWPAEIASWQAHHGGVHYGVGLELTELEGGIYVDRPLLDTPAWSSGIHQGDQILTIRDARGEITLSDFPADRRFTLAEAALQGDVDSAVSVTVLRIDEEAPREFALVRGPVKLQTLFGHHREADNSWNRWLSESDGLAYVRIRVFRDYTEDDFDAFTEPLLDGIRGLVLDLRGNPGGDVNSAVQIADRFIVDGILAELSGRVEPETGPDVDPVTGQELIPWNHAIEGHALEGIAVVVLVDTDTASAAEILAGSLQERAGAHVVGAPTWGKGLAQALRSELELGYAVQFTNQIWTLPSGRRLDRRTDGGVQPDFTINLSPAERFQIDLSARQRSATLAHADGHPITWLDTVRRSDLPPLSDDPAMLWGELVLRAMLAQSQSPTGP